MMIFACSNNYNITGFDRIIYTVNRDDSRTLQEDEHFIHVVHVTRFGMSGFAGLEDMNAATGDLCVAKDIRHQSPAICIEVGNGHSLHGIYLPATSTKMGIAIERILAIYNVFPTTRVIPE